MTSFDGKILGHIFAHGQLEYWLESGFQERLKDHYGLARLRASTDLFSAVCSIVWRPQHIIEAVHAVVKVTTPAAPPPTYDEALPEAAKQLRMLAASQIAHYYKTDRRSQQLFETLNETAEQYVERLRTDYPGDLLCLWFFANYLKVNFRIWLPKEKDGLPGEEKKPFFLSGSDISTQSPRTQPAYNLAVTSEDKMEDGEKPAERFQLQFFPLVGKEVGFTGQRRVASVPMQDPSRICRDPASSVDSTTNRFKRTSEVTPTLVRHSRKKRDGRPPPQVFTA